MSKTAWGHLQNAAHIDRVLASVKAHPDEWTAACKSARLAAWDAACKSARLAAWDAAGYAAGYAAGDAAWSAARGAIAALIAWDESAQYLAMTADELRVFYALSERPECVLLLPAAVAFERIAAKELVAA